MGIHKGMSYVCNQCQYKATQKGDLKKHILAVHEVVRYCCGECDSTFVWHRDLKKHIQSVHDEVRYDCSQCEYKGTQQSYLVTQKQSIY